MMKNAVFYRFGRIVAAGGAAFMPQSHRHHTWPPGATLKKASKQVGKFASVCRTLASTTTILGIPASSAVATAAAKQQAAPASNMTNKNNQGFMAAAALALVAAGSCVATMTLFSTATPREEETEDTAMVVQKINSAFGGAMKNQDLVHAVASSLQPYGYNGESTLLVTSLCVDEINRPLEHDFVNLYHNNFQMGGLSGFAFGGLTAFVNMAANIPDGGSCLILYGPHVGVDCDGTVGTVPRRGRKVGGPCCDSAVAAATHVLDRSLAGRQKEPATPSTDPLDAQQDLVTRVLLPHAARLEQAPDIMVELPFVLYEEQKRLMDAIVQAGCGSVAGEGKIAVLGGIQINTPPGQSDYFLPLSYELLDNKGKKIADLMSTL